MHSLRRALCWLFGLSSFICVQLVVFNFVRAILYPKNASSLNGSLLIFAIFAPLAILFGETWWAIWKGRRSARRWALVSSVVNIALGSWPLLLFRQFDSFPSPLLAQAGIGIAGLIAFWRPYEETALADESVQETSAGDGTNFILNKFSELLILLPIVVLFPWWVRWCYGKGVAESRIPIVLIFFAAGLLITVIHELGHTLIGLLLGMRLRALQIGPCLWRIADGKWGFEFTLSRLLVDDGGTSVVPITAQFSRLRHILVIVGGPLVNFLSGGFALWLANSRPGDSPLQLGGGLAFFGAFSIGTGLINLIPFRSRSGYSDGAQLRQLLAGGPWAELHRIVAVVKSSLVTPLRPRDFDIDAINRAAEAITIGSHGLLLRLYAFVHYLDRGDMEAAGRAIRDAEAVVHRSIGDTADRLESEFVFGYSFAVREPVAAREWWKKFEAKKPRFNSDYWKASCALHWVEGSHDSAVDAWSEGNALAQGLPNAGAYDFERHCFGLLRNALDGTTSKSTSA